MPKLILFLVLLVPFVAVGQTEVSATYGSGNEPVLSFYQKHISPIRGSRACPMYPSCSQYAKMAYHSTGLITATLQTADRLMRCGHDNHTYERISLDGHSFYKDLINPDTTITPGLFRNEFNTDSFVDFLIEKHNYDLALLELERQLYDSIENTEITNYKIALIYALKGDIQQVQQVYVRLILNGVENMEVFQKTSLILAQLHISNANFTQARLIMRPISSNTLTSQLNAEILLRESKIEEAKKAIMSLEHVQNNSQKLDAAKTLVTNYHHLPHKKPVLASSLGIIPGLGYAYAGRKGTALMAFVINAIFAWTAMEAYRHENYGLFTASSFLGLGWYVGSIRGSYESAITFNERTQNQFIDTNLTIIKP